MVFVLAGTLAAQMRPPATYVSPDACPFECCTYREWTARSSVTLYDKAQGRASGKINKGERVQGLTGQVITHPLAFRIASEQDGIPAGATVYLLHPLGEGVWRVWYEGKVHDIELDVAEEPRYEWWTKVKTASGQIGWVRMPHSLPFDNVDACGD